VVSGPHAIVATARSAASPERVFAVLEDGPGWKDWAGFPLAEYEREGTPGPHGVGAVRRLGNRFASTREEVVAYDPPRHFAYRILSGLPVKEYRADVTLTPDRTGTTIDWASTFVPKVPGTGWLLAPFLRMFLRLFARALARHAEA
jgi:uncharacterized protein YndB with AHSA1/START domain